MYCKNCGTWLPDHAEVCAVCGSRIPKRRRSTAPQKNNNGILLGALAIVAVVLVTALICFSVLTRSKQAAQLERYRIDQDDTASEQTETLTGSSSEEESDTVINYYYYYDSEHESDDFYDNVSDDGYLWPTSTQYISRSDLQAFSQDTVRAILNEIYARQGFVFEKEYWKTYFERKTWYNRDPNCTDQTTAEARMNSIEKANLNTIIAYEEAMGWR